MVPGDRQPDGKLRDDLNGLASGGGYLVGGTLALADLHLAPMMLYLAMTEGGTTLVDALPRLGPWLGRMATRPSLSQTRPTLPARR